MFATPGEGPPLWLQVLLPALWLLLVFGLAEALNRLQKPVSSELARKTVHIGVGNVILLAWWLEVPTWLGLGAATLFAGLMGLSYRLPILRSINGVGRQSFGTLFYALSIGTLILAFWPAGLPQYAALGILVMAWGDGLAALVGQRWGKHVYKIGGMTKTLEGSLTMVLASYTVTAIVLALAQGPSLATLLLIPLPVALLAAALEMFSIKGIDNLSVPLGSALVAWGLTVALGI
ncbi:phosphatidate cytidylyltransferase [Leptolyngbya sp. FACHB-261]|nr:phosphatidate cytidylyltransferase [Leptolyngbya sp. FACHB-261]